MGKASRRKAPKVIAGLPLVRRCKLHAAALIKGIENAGMSWLEYSQALMAGDADSIGRVGMQAVSYWTTCGSTVWIVRGETQEMFMRAGLRGMDRSEVVMPAECMYFALPDSQIDMRGEDGQIHRLAGFYLLESEGCLGLLMWGASNNPARPSDDVLLWAAFPWDDGAKTDLEAALTEALSAPGGSWAEGQREAQVEMARAIGVQCLRLAINSLLYLRHCIEDQGPPVEVDEILNGKLAALNGDITPARRERLERQVADMWVARRFYELAPDLARQHRQAELRRRSKPSKRAGYTVGWHVRWTRYGRAKDDNGNPIPAHLRPARLTVIDSYEVAPSHDAS